MDKHTRNKYKIERIPNSKREIFVMTIYEFLHQQATEKAKNHEQSDFELLGFWQSEYLLHPNRRERRFHLYYVLAQTKEQGCCYYQPETYPIELPNGLIGSHALEIEDAPLAIKIAALDSVYGVFKPTPDESFTVTGRVADKASERAKIVYNETLKLIEKKSPLSKPQKILNVGVVTNIVKFFTDHNNFEVQATDFDETLIGKKLFDKAPVHSGEYTLDLVAESDVAIITGMTLATESLDAIVETAKANNTLIVMFAETGANFAREYCNYGIDLVVSEPFPFYMVSNGESLIDVYRR